MRVVRIFLSTPSDVDLERSELDQLVRELNDAIQFLAPERDLRLELVRYETHSFPDVGPPQEVIDRQIPIDFDIYLGIMWQRAGTPTPDHPSGTIHEFHQALEHRERHGWPTIMFFFCDEPIAVPNDLDGLDQLREVVRFREYLSSIGLTVTYPRRQGFREVVRGRLLRALADVISRPPAPADTVGSAQIAADAADALAHLASSYDEVRATMTSGRDRTRLMSSLFVEMVALAPRIRPKLQQLQASEAAGERLAAIAVLHAFPDANELDWLAARLDNPESEAPFIGYQAAVALRQAVQSLPPPAAPALRQALDHALTLARKLPQDPDRIRVLEFALRDLGTSEVR